MFTSFFVFFFRITLIISETLFFNFILFRKLCYREFRIWRIMSTGNCLKLRILQNNLLDLISICEFIEFTRNYEYIFVVNVLQCVLLHYYMAIFKFLNNFAISTSHTLKILKVFLWLG